MDGMIVTIAQQKGGSGKTTLAANLAVAWRLLHRKNVALLDIDPQGSLGEWFEAREEALGPDGAGLSFRTASGWGARREARALVRDHDIVLVDTPPKSERDSKPAVESAQLVIVPVQPSPVDLWATRPTIAMADESRVPARLVLNRVPPRALITEEMAAAMSAFSANTTDARIGNRVAFAASMGVGRTAVESEPKGKAAGEITALARELLKTIA